MGDAYLSEDETSSIGGGSPVPVMVTDILDQRLEIESDSL
jgi:hypothetical protein